MARTDTERLDWLAKQQGNLFTPATGMEGTWAWFGNDNRRGSAGTLRGLIDSFMDEPHHQGTSE